MDAFIARGYWIPYLKTNMWVSGHSGLQSGSFVCQNTDLPYQIKMRLQPYGTQS